MNIKHLIHSIIVIISTTCAAQNSNKITLGANNTFYHQKTNSFFCIGLNGSYKYQLKNPKLKVNADISIYFPLSHISNDSAMFAKSALGLVIKQKGSNFYVINTGIVYGSFNDQTNWILEAGYGRNFKGISSGDEIILNFGFGTSSIFHIQLLYCIEIF